MKAQTYSRQGAPDSRGAFTVTMVISFCCHVLFFALLLYTPDFKKEHRRFPSGVINVDLVSLPDLSPTTVAVAAEKAPARAASPKPVKTPPKDAVSIKKKPAKKPKTKPAKPKKKKTSLKKKTFKAERAIKKAIQKVEKEVEEKRSPQLEKALAKLREQVAKNPQKPDIKPAAPTSNGNTSALGVPGGGGLGRKGEVTIERVYILQLQNHIKKNWAFSERIAGAGNNMQAIVQVKVLPNGKITDLWFEKRSGNSHLDDSARRAILKSDPLPGHPPGLLKPFVSLGIVFDPED